MIRRDVRPSKVLGLFVSDFIIGETRVGLKTETCWKGERGMTKSWLVEKDFFFGGVPNKPVVRLSSPVEQICHQVLWQTTKDCLQMDESQLTKSRSIS